MMSMSFYLVHKVRKSDPDASVRQCTLHVKVDSRRKQFGKRSMNGTQCNRCTSRKDAHAWTGEIILEGRYECLTILVQSGRP